MVLVDVYIPALDNSFDFMLDENMLIEKLITEITEMIMKKVSAHDKLANSNFYLYAMQEQMILDRYKTLSLCGIKNGTRLMLV